MFADRECTSKWCPAVARVFLSLLFVVGGAGFLMNFNGTVGYVAMGLTPWGLAGLATIATVVAIVLKLGGGLMLLFGIRVPLATMMLIAFTVLATLMYHLDWGGPQGQMQMTMFLKNLAIIGGLMAIHHTACSWKRGENTGQNA